MKIGATSMTVENFLPNQKNILVILAKIKINEIPNENPSVL